ncbi:MAG: ATP-binding cassette domain-containing protein [Clostridium sp.]|nr:ATP-binding cassette domain-containing protein [Clostridium sp.]MCM1399792.1 ATP-binding cassette domain-containing protein [Clostridium sp.]MCM1459581.1 ATP-binding cassette domain-containing protein [Bacteroides sp.]
MTGINGSGKTMLMRCITGLVFPDSGEVLFDHCLLGKEISFPPSVGILIENPKFLKSYTGFQNLKMLGDIQGNIDENDIHKAMERVGLSASDKRKYSNYSLGMCQRLGVAAAILGEPELIILDEPTNAIDDHGVELIWEVIRELLSEDRIIILACHDKEKMEGIADTIIKMEEGHIVEVVNNEIVSNA